MSYIFLPLLMNHPLLATSFHLASCPRPREIQGRIAAIVMTATRHTVPQRLRPAALESMARAKKKRGENRWKIAGKRVCCFSTRIDFDRNFSGVFLWMPWATNKNLLITYDPPACTD